MDSDGDAYYEESSSEAEEEVTGPLHVNLQVTLEESPESPQPVSPCCRRRQLPWANCPLSRSYQITR